MNILVTAALAFFFAIGLGLAAAGGIRAAWRNCEGRRGVFAALAILGVKKAERIGFHSGVGTLVTLYVAAAGAVSCGGMPFGFAPAF